MHLRPYEVLSNRHPYPILLHRESIELRFRCRCSPEKCPECVLSPVTAAYRSGQLGALEYRSSEAFYTL
eukprot:51992-Pyramimonas_sp.AAC.1